ADNKTKTYGQLNPTLTATITGTVNGDILNYTLSTSATQFSGVGTYAITVSLGSNPNYNVTATNGTLTINQANATGTANNKIKAENRTKTFGDTYTADTTTPSLDFTVTDTLYNGDTVTSIMLTSAGYAAGATVAGSPYTITPSAAVGTGLGNYTISYVNGSLT